MSTPRKKVKQKPSAFGDVLSSVLKSSGMAARVEQASIIPEWASLIGTQIASVTDPQSISADGTLFVYVKTNAWMNELSMMEPELLKALNARVGKSPVKRIRWLLKRG